MKRLILICLCFLMLSIPCALAQGAVWDDCDAPKEIKTFFEQRKYDTLILTNCVIAHNHTTGYDYAFLTGRKGSENILYAFEKTGSQSSFEYWLVNGSALPSGGILTLETAEKWDFLSASEDARRYVEGPVLKITWQSTDQKTIRHFIYAQEGTSGQWRMKYNFQSSTNPDIPFYAVLTYEDHLHYLTKNDGETIGRAYGNVQTNLRYLDISAFPTSLSAAREKLSSAPVLPASSQLQGKEITFTGGQKFPVYSGPGEQYVRAANGKASVSTNDWIQVFGTEKGYVLIQYALSSDRMRFGYIDQNVLPKNALVSALSLDHAAARITSPCAMTDDPLYSRSTVLSLQQGEEVTWLATMGGWVYIECERAAQRGFVPLSYIEKAPQDISLDALYSNELYTTRATLTTRNGDATITGVITPWDASRTPEGYALLLNQSVADQVTSFTADRTFSFSIPALWEKGIRIVALCPLYDGQYRYDEIIRFILP